MAAAHMCMWWCLVALGGVTDTQSSLRVITLTDDLLPCMLRLVAALLPAGCYMMSNAEEYWAEGCQSWFDATVRADVNSDIITREKLKAHDPDFAALLTEVRHLLSHIWHSRRRWSANHCCGGRGL